MYQERWNVEPPYHSLIGLEPTPPLVLIPPDEGGTHLVWSQIGPMALYWPPTVQVGHMHHHGKNLPPRWIFRVGPRLYACPRPIFLAWYYSTALCTAVLQVPAAAGHSHFLVQHCRL